MPVDIDKFVKRLNDNADTTGWGKGQCGQYVRMALQAGGAKIPQPYPATGKEYGPTLLMLGFHKITVDNPDKFHFMKGDVMVMESYKANGAGHVAAYNGKKWISDFAQTDFWAGPDYRKKRPTYAVYRY